MLSACQFHTLLHHLSCVNGRQAIIRGGHSTEPTDLRSDRRLWMMRMMLDGVLPVHHLYIADEAVSLSAPALHLLS